MLHTLFGFQGRIGRGSWWLAQLIAIPVVYLVGFGMLAGAMGLDGSLDGTDPATGAAIFLIIVLAVGAGLWINIASTVKRYHDRDKSGLWTFIVLVPFIGGIWQMVECGFCNGDGGDNRFGPPGGSGGGYSDAASASGGKLAKLDDDYFRTYAAQGQAAEPPRMPEPVVQATYVRPAATVSAGTGKPVFGRR